MPTDPYPGMTIDETLAELIERTAGRADVRAEDLRSFARSQSGPVAADPKEPDVCILCDAPNDVCDPCDNKDFSCTPQGDLLCVTCDTADV